MPLVSVQYLRAAAALMVVVFHTKAHLARMGTETAALDWLASGVDVFFVISGLIMWHTTAEHPARPRDFLLRRLIRIVPLYWLLTTVMVVATLAVPGLLRTAGFDGPHILASYAFLPWTHPVTEEAMPILIPGWTLNYEMAFYLLFGTSLLLPARARFWAVGCAFVALILLSRALPVPGVVLQFYGNDIILEFWFGMVVGAMLRAGRVPGPRLGAVLLVAGLAALPGAWALATSWPRGVVVGVPAALVVLGALALERAGRVPLSRAGLLLGDASYALYLSHVIVLAAVAAGWRRLPVEGLVANLGFVAVAAAAAVAASIPLFLVVEKPARDWLHRRVTLRSGTPGPAGPPFWARRPAGAP